jgi:energy-coupling factor transporter ATP-binding protein EcfA2
MGTSLITIENCNSIEKANIEITEGTLNIKYGPNGLGKSTIAKAIFASAVDHELLKILKPFKYRASEGHNEPFVAGAEHIKSVLVFDDTYISQFVFQHDEVLRNL